jgi:antitoxin PrlF
VAANGTTVTSKGQVTIPQRIREAMNLKPGCQVIFDVSEDGRVFLRKSGRKEKRRPDRFDRAVGASRIKWNGTTDAYMELIRGYSEDPAVDPVHSARP